MLVLTEVLLRRLRDCRGIDNNTHFMKANAVGKNVTPDKRHIMRSRSQNQAFFKYFAFKEMFM